MLECDQERGLTNRVRLEADCSQLISRIGDLKERLQEITLAYDESDFEAAPYVKEAKSLLDDMDDSHTSVRLEDAADDLSAAELRRACRKLYMKICLKVHPDKTGGIESELFIKACAYYESCDLSALTILLSDLTDQTTDHNLLEAYKTRIEGVKWDHELYHETEEWYYYTVNLDMGYATALGEYRCDLALMIESLETMINRELEINM